MAFTFIGDHIDSVISLLSGRMDKSSSISTWILRGYQDIAHTIPFEELENTLNTIFAPNIDTLDYPADGRAIKDIEMGFPASNPTAFRPIYKRNKDIINRYSPTIPGGPAIWAPFKFSMFFRPVPDQAYPVIIDYWRKVSANPQDINNTMLEVPDDWLEIIEYEAQMRGWIDLQEYDKASAMRQFLWGDPNPAKRQPGLIKEKLTRIQAEYMNANYGMRPRFTRFGSGMK